MRWPSWNATEFLFLPIIAFPYLYFYLEYEGAGAFFGGGVLTLMASLAAFYRSRTILKRLPRENQCSENLEPVWPAFIGIVLFFLAALQIILAVTHISYFRTHNLGDYI